MATQRQATNINLNLNIKHLDAQTRYATKRYVKIKHIEKARIGVRDPTSSKIPPHTPPAVLLIRNRKR
jgi:hypothetical protein